MLREIVLVALLAGACAFDPLGPGAPRREDDEEETSPDAGTVDDADAGSSDAGDRCAEGAREVTDEFTQASGIPLDVLLVVDDSGSMEPIQQEAVLAMSPFLAELDRIRVDFHVGVVTTDMDLSNLNAGVLRKTSTDSVRIVTPGEDATTRVQNIVRSLGIGGSGNEKGLEAMRAALSEPTASDPTKNLGFRRSDARLAVIVVSDEDDSSPDTTADYSSFLDSRGDAVRAPTELDAVVGANPSGCQGTFESQAGSRYLAVQQATGGLATSLCSTPWDTFFVDVARHASGARTRFPLTRVPLSAPTSVVANEVPQASMLWSFENGAIVFDAPPEGGARIVVTYCAARE